MSVDEAAALLGVGADAPVSAVQHAYVRAARRAHPDTLPHATDPERAEAAARFDALSRARRVLLDATPAVPIHVDIAAEPAQYRRTEERGFGNALLVLAVMAFMMIAIVSLTDAFRMETAPDVGRTPVPAHVTPSP